MKFFHPINYNQNIRNNLSSLTHDSYTNGLQVTKIVKGLVTKTQAKIPYSVRMTTATRISPWKIAPCISSRTFRTRETTTGDSWNVPRTISWKNLSVTSTLQTSHSTWWETVMV